MKKKDFQRGAVSVFLTVILVPCIAVSSLFVDLSRVKLSKSVATSSADLALNSLMAHYDTDLSEFYGMMASCQNIEDFYEEAAQYYLDALHSQGLADEDIDSLLALYTSIMGDDTVYDLLQMEEQKEEDKLISKVSGGALGESSTIIKDQIVEFMKYRAPVEITKGIIERLKQANVNDLAEVDENEELVEKKKDYAEAEADLMEKAFDTYVALKEYVDLHATLIELKKWTADLKTYRETYREINRLIVSNFHGTENLSIFARPTYALDTYKNDYRKDMSSVYSRKETIDGTEHYYIDQEDITKILEDVVKDITDFNKAKDALVNEVGTDLINATGHNDIQWWKAVDKKINSHSRLANYKKAAEALLKTYAKMAAMHECELDEGVTTDWETEYANKVNDIAAIQSKYLVAGVSSPSSDMYIKLVSKLETVSGNNINEINPSVKKLSTGKTVSQAITDIGNALTEAREKLDSYVEALNTVIDGKLFVVDSLDSFKKAVEKFQTSYGAWKDEAYRLDTDMADADRNEIEGKDKDGNPVEDPMNVTQWCKQLTTANVDELKTRLVNIRSQMKEVISAIDSMKYGGKKLKDIKSYSTAYSQIKWKIGEVPMGDSEIATYAETIFQNNFTPYTTDKSAEVYKLEHADDPNYNPDLTVSKPKLYEVLENRFKDTVKDKETIKEKKEEKKAGKKKAEEEEKRAKRDRMEGISSNNIYGGSYNGGEFPSGLDVGSPFKMGKNFINGFTTFVTNLVNGNFTAMRDDLYSTEYVMDMFSYASFENEGKYNMLDGKFGDEPITYQNYSNAYSTIIGSADAKGTWLSENPIDTENKTLTNHMINVANNVAMGAEVEYILHGKTNKENIKETYTDIYEIRYALNTVSAFQHFWSRSPGTGEAVNDLAQAIAWATQGVVPAPATKSVLLLLLTAFETSKDLDRLQYGLPVELYKKENEWYYTMDKWNPKENDLTTSSGLFYSDYLYFFVYLGFADNSTANEMYLRAADVMQVNMRKYTGSGGYSLNQSQVYFKLDSTLRVKPLMLTLPYSAGYSNNPKDTTDWCTFDISKIRGYS